MKTDWTFEELKAKQDECNKFARDNIYQLCKDTIEFQDEAVLPEGPLKELAEKCSWAGHTKLLVAQSFIARAAYESLIKHIEWHRAT